MTHAWTACQCWLGPRSDDPLRRGLNSCHHHNSTCQATDGVVSKIIAWNWHSLLKRILMLWRGV